MFLSKYIPKNHRDRLPSSAPPSKQLSDLNSGYKGEITWSKAVRKMVRHNPIIIVTNRLELIPDSPTAAFPVCCPATAVLGFSPFSDDAAISDGKVIEAVFTRSVV